jgi:imidazolonepropionase-like amidohydrolase
MIRCTVACLLTALLGAPLAAETLYISAERIYTSGPQGIIEDGAILIEDGKISRIGTTTELQPPAVARRLKAAVAVPGLIDSHTVVGVNGGYNTPKDQDGFEASNATGPQYRVLDSFNPLEKLVTHANNLGTTTIHVTPQPTAPIGGSSALFKTRGTMADQMLVRSDVAVLFSLGEAPKAAFKESGPGSRMAVAATIRSELYKARQWAAKDEDDRDVDLGMQALARVLAGESLALFSAHREDDIATALRIAREFDLKAMINYGTEAYLLIPQLIEDKATIVLAPTMQRPQAFEKRNSSLEAAAILHRANVSIVFGSGYEGYVPKSRVLLWELAIAVANGLPAEDAIAAATIEPAKLWGVADRIGSLEPGKDADIVLFDGDPFEYTTHVTAVIVEGDVNEKEM